MKIQSRKYKDRIHDVTLDQWELMKDNGLSRNFKVIDSSEMVVRTDAPFEVIDFIKKKQKQKPKTKVKNERSIKKTAGKPADKTV